MVVSCWIIHCISVRCWILDIGLLDLLFPPLHLHDIFSSSNLVVLISHLDWVLIGLESGSAYRRFHLEDLNGKERKEWFCLDV